MRTLLISCFLFLNILVSCIYSQSITWTETQPCGNIDRTWTSATLSPDGTKMIASAGGNGLYIYKADTWVRTYPIAGNPFWSIGSMNSDGTKILQGSSNGLFLSTNSGDNWTAINPFGKIYWDFTSMSPDGSKMLAGANLGRIYLSTNGGSIWSEVRPAGNVNLPWNFTTISADGSKIFVGAKGGRLYISTNGGSLWTETQPAGNINQNWYSGSISSDGNTLFVCVMGGRLYLSTNCGTNWTETQPIGNTDNAWCAVSLSADGSKMFTGVNGGRLYVSSNNGLNWIETLPAEDANYLWTITSMNADGTKLLTGARDSRIYFNNEPLPVELKLFNAATSDESIILNWQTATEINNYGFEVQRSCKNSNWENIGFINGHGNSNSPKFYSFTDKVVSRGKYSYRLKQIDFDGSYEFSNEIEVTFGRPIEYVLQNYPNPFNPSTTIKYSVPNPERVVIKVFDVLGKEIITLLDEYKDAGTYQIQFDASNLTSGFYFCKIRAGNYTETKKMLLMR